MKDSLLDETQTNLNLDLAYKRIGGYGLFQLFATLMIAVWRNTGTWCTSMFPYLILPSKYECRFEEGGDWNACEADVHICPRLDSRDDFI